MNLIANVSLLSFEGNLKLDTGVLNFELGTDVRPEASTTTL